MWFFVCFRFRKSDRMGCTKPLLEMEKLTTSSSEPVFDILPSTLILKIFSMLNAGEGTDIRMLSRCAQVWIARIARIDCIMIKGFTIMASISARRKQLANSWFVRVSKRCDAKSSQEHFFEMRRIFTKAFDPRLPKYRRLDDRRFHRELSEHNALEFVRL